MVIRTTVIFDVHYDVVMLHYDVASIWTMFMTSFFIYFLHFFLFFSFACQKLSNEISLLTGENAQKIIFGAFFVRNNQRR